MKTIRLTRVDFAPFQVDEGVMIGEEPTAGQLAVARQIDELNRAHGFMYLVATLPFVLKNEKIALLL